MIFRLLELGIPADYMIAGPPGPLGVRLSSDKN